MKKQHINLLIVISILFLLFLSCEGIAGLFHGPKPEEEMIQTYTVTFDANGSSGIAPAKMTVTAGSSITLPGAGGLFKNDYVFNGWNTNIPGTGDQYNAGFSYTVIGDVTLYARWIVGFSISFNANGGSGITQHHQLKLAESQKYYYDQKGDYERI